jgi:hypothetical protein
MIRHPRLSAWLGAAIAVVLVWSVVSVVQAQTASAQNARPSRTPWGHPNLQGVWTSDSVMGVPFEKPRTEPLTAEEKSFQDRLKAIEAQLDPGGSNVVWNERRLNRAIKRPASLVVEPPDGRVPITQEVKSAITDFDRDVRRYGIGIGSWEDLDLWDRCITKGFPTVMMPLGYSNMYQIFQTPNYVAIFYEVIHDVRIIPVDGRSHIGSQLRQWWGDSRGHWEGDTLVVDVTNFSDKTFLTQQPTGQFRGGGKDMHIVERWRVNEEGNLDYRATITDPRSYTKPWTMAVPLAPDNEHVVLEYACHEGNYGMRNILSAAFKAREAGTAK